MEPKASRPAQHILFFLTILLALVILQGEAWASRLTWVDASNNEDGFRVERQTNGGAFTLLRTLGANVTAYSDTALFEGIQYCYRVLAFNASGSSGYSNLACATTPSSSFSLTVQKTGTGSGLVSGQGINCGGDCSESYTSLASVSLSAAPAAGSVFTGWGGTGCSGTASCSLLFNADTLITSSFALAGGSADFCSVASPCAAGQGDCDSNSQCRTGLVCAQNVGANFGWPAGTDVCQASASSLPVGHADFCSAASPCAAGQGDCDSKKQCRTGLVCAQDVGANYGWPAGTDVCQASASSLPVGHPDFCSAASPCAAGQGDCDSDGQCRTGLVCAQNVGANYGWPAGTDVCQASASSLPVGHPDFCSAASPCAASQGDCDSDGQCRTGLVCAWNVGANYGWAAGIDVCQTTP